MCEQPVRIGTTFGPVDYVLAELWTTLPELFSQSHERKLTKCETIVKTCQQKKENLQYLVLRHLAATVPTLVSASATRPAVRRTSFILNELHGAV